MKYEFVFLGLLAMGGIVLLMPSEGDANRKEWDGMELRDLNQAEKKVIMEKGTERPFTGEYVNHKAEGIYCC